jgi:hypothetical protein
VARAPFGGEPDARPRTLTNRTAGITAGSARRDPLGDEVGKGRFRHVARLARPMGANPSAPFSRSGLAPIRRRAEQAVEPLPDAVPSVRQRVATADRCSRQIRRSLTLSYKRVERRLTAILAADAAGSSRLTGLDEEGTHARRQDPCVHL